MHPVMEAERALRRRRAAVVSGLATVLWGLWIWSEARQSGRPVPMSGFGWMAASFVAIIVARRWAARREPDQRAVARRVEGLFPGLDGRLITALEPVTDRKDRVESFLRHRLEGEVQTHLRKNFWDETYRRRERLGYGAGQVAVGLAMLVVTVLLVSVHAPRSGGAPTAQVMAGVPRVEVSPGDAEVERGTKLVVEARFAGGAPGEAILEWLDGSGEQVEERFEMRRSLDDPVYGAVMPRVDRDGRYRVVFSSPGGGQPGKSDTYRVGVYVHPELERADVTVRPPDYTGEKERLLRDVRRVSALEGSGLRFRLEVNKPVAEAELFGEDGTIVPLKGKEPDATVLLAEMRPQASQRYRVHLVDAEGRANKEPPWIQVQIKENQRPKLELSFPGKDVEVSALQEMALEGKVWDDLGVERVGVAMTVGERTKEMVLEDRALPGRQKHEWQATFALEELGAEPAQLVSYHVWAEDKGPSGELRRTESDLFLAEVRHWEHSFREAPPSGEGQPGKGTQSEQLRNQQKDIISATWNLARRIERLGVEGAREDLKVVRRSQEIVMGNTAGAMQDMPDAELVRLLSQARDKMEEATGFLGWVEEQRDANPMKDALQAERGAYQFLLQAESRETQVTRAKAPASAAGSSEQKQQRRLMDLELKQEEDRYETERQAQSEAQSEQQADLEILRRLKELAQRQEAVVDRLRELQAKLEEARTAKEREEVERQLKRLREEQEELMRDVDQLMERMEGRENEDRLAEERRRLEAAREQARQAEEDLGKGRLAEAANAATRAQEEMKDLQEGFRERTAQRFAEEMRQMRDAARDLARKQEEIGGMLEQAPDARNPFESEEAAGVRRDMLTRLGEQRERLDELLQGMRQVSEQAEVPEPVLSSALYEAVRRTRAEGLDEALDQAVTEVRFGDPDQAVQPERAAARALDQLKTDVEKAAEGVLGSETESLRQARAELDRLIGAMEEEAGGKAESGKLKAEMEEAKSSGLQPPASGLNLFFDRPEAEPDRGPLTGDGYAGWADGMRRIEDLLENPALRSEASRILDRAREFRIGYRSNNSAPKWDLVQTTVVRPLVELRDRVAEELARLEKGDALVPIDRDPVPVPYRELVRRYYEKLARGE